MKESLKKFFILVLAALGPVWMAEGQNIVWNANFDFRFDNREYGDPSRMIAPSGTLFGANMRPEIGIGWGYGHSLMIGTTIPADMGSENFMGMPELLAYYSWDGELFRAAMGFLPRERMKSQFSRAFFSESFLFYHPTIEGCLVQYVRPEWFVELACDWNGLRSATRREMFTIIFAGEAHRGLSYAGYAATLHHHAASDTARGVVDNGLANFYIGVDFSPLFNKGTTAKLQAGWLQAYQNDRLHIGTPVLPGGYELDLYFHHSDVGLRNTFYKGKDLMPYWNLPYEDGKGGAYADNLYFGDPFYRVGESGFYNRLELFWEPRLKAGVNLRISSVHHYDGVNWGWQQVVALRVNIGSDMFGIIR